MWIAEPHARYARDAAPVFREAHRYPGTLTRETPIWKRPDVYLVVTGVTLAIIVGGTLFKTAMLSGGGPAVAESMGGRPLQPDSGYSKVLTSVVQSDESHPPEARPPPRRSGSPQSPPHRSADASRECHHQTSRYSLRPRFRGRCKLPLCWER
jgi:hypothetical protein